MNAVTADAAPAVISNDATEGTSNLPVVQKLTEQQEHRAHAVRTAKLLGTKYVSDRDDIPGEFRITAQRGLLELCKEGGVYAVSDDGIILLSDVSQQTIKKIRHGVRKHLNAKSTIKIYPTAQFVVESVLASAEAEEGGNSRVKLHDDGQRSAPQRYLDSLIGHALDTGASDIHLIIGRDSASILYRVKRSIIEREVGIARDRIMNMMRAAINYDAIVGSGQANKTFDASVPNDASFEVKISNDRRIQIRLASVPIQDGGCAVALRLIGSGIGKSPSLNLLGYLAEQTMLYEQAATMPFGAIIISGPTGSGKSTTLRSAIALAPDNKRIYSFEDPIEADMAGVTQCPVNEENPELTWINLAKTSLRLDPDIIVFGELRSKEVAEIFTRAATTGHLVFTTLHTNSAIDIIPALQEMGVSYQRLSDPTFIRILGAQRLIPGICTNCAVPAIHGLKKNIRDERLREYFKDDLLNIFCASEVGCEHCDYTGSAGDRLIAEVICLDGKDRELIASGDTNRWLAHLKDKGWRDMKAHAELQVREGLLCVQSADKSLTTGFGIETGSDAFDYNAMRRFAEANE